MQKLLTAIIEREGDGYVPLCPEFDIARQGGTIEVARENLKEALELFLKPLRRRKSRNARADNILRCHAERSEASPACALRRWGSFASFRMTKGGSE